MHERWTRARFAALAVAALATALLLACGDDDGAAKSPAATATSGSQATATPAQANSGGAAQQAATVKVTDNAFQPVEVTVATGGKVTWDWTGSANPHAVQGTSDNAKGLLQSQTFSGGNGKYEVTFSQPGTYKYQCMVHGAAMPGTIVVK
jgi:plastocyanin